MGFTFSVKTCVRRSDLVGDLKKVERVQKSL